MVLLFRFLFAMLRSRFRSRLGPLDESVTHFTALPTDCDLNFHLNAGRYVSFMDVARLELFGRLRVVVPMLRRGWRPVLGGALLRYRRSVLPFERFAIRSRITGWDEKWFYVEHVVVKGANTFCAVGQTRTLIRGAEGNLPPSEILVLMKHAGAQSPPLPDAIVKWRELEDVR